MTQGRAAALRKAAANTRSVAVVWASNRLACIMICAPGKGEAPARRPHRPARPSPAAGAGVARRCPNGPRRSRWRRRRQEMRQSRGLGRGQEPGRGFAHAAFVGDGDQGQQLAVQPGADAGEPSVLVLEQQLAIATFALAPDHGHVGQAVVELRDDVARIVDPHFQHQRGIAGVHRARISGSSGPATWSLIAMVSSRSGSGGSSAPALARRAGCGRAAGRPRIRGRRTCLGVRSSRRRQPRLRAAAARLTPAWVSQGLRRVRESCASRPPGRRPPPRKDQMWAHGIY